MYRFSYVIYPYASFEGLVPTLLPEFVEKIVIHELEAPDGSQPDRERQNFLYFFYFFISHEKKCP